MSENEIIEEQESVDAIDSAVEETADEVSADETGTDGEDAYARLSREVAELRSMIEARKEGREDGEANPRALGEEFRRLYPSVAADDVPDEVWQDVQNGIPAEAAYALWERREAVRRETAAEANRRNADGGWGRAERAGEDFLSPDEVRAMTQTEVRRNYARIIESMKHWN